MACLFWLSPHNQYVVNGNEYNLGYYLADGIYPRWATLVKTISQPDTPKKDYLPKNKRLIGRMSKEPSEYFRLDGQSLGDLHDEHEDLDAEYDDEDNCPRTSRRARARLAYELEPTITYDINRDRQTISDYMVRHNRVRASQVHHNLRNDLINHIWRFEGEGQ
ncbi:unnamed protein product [Prunus brigantina]